MSFMFRVEELVCRRHRYQRWIWVYLGIFVGFVEAVPAVIWRFVGSRPLCFPRLGKELR